MTKFIKANMLLRAGQKQPMLINLAEVAAVKRFNEDSCLVTMIHSDTYGNKSYEIDTPFDELWRQLRTNNLVAEP